MVKPLASKNAVPVSLKVAVDVVSVPSGAHEGVRHRLCVTEMHRLICSNGWKSESAGASDAGEQTKIDGNASV
jgi:hypothetical protein